MMRASLRVFAVSLAAAWLVLAPGLAGANELDQAKAAGHVGEQADGYLGVPPGGPSSAKALVARINKQRAAKYAEIAKKNGTDPAAVAALAGQKLVDRTPSGQWYRDASSTWKKR